MPKAVKDLRKSKAKLGKKPAPAAAKKPAREVAKKR